MALILRYFTEFAYDVVVKELLGLPCFQHLLLIFDNNNSQDDVSGFKQTG